MEQSNKIVLFQEKRIRKIWHDEQWFFSVIDVIGVLSESKDPRNYWKVLKNREPQLVTICNQLKMEATDGRQRVTDCANTEGVFRIIMSVPSPHAEPFKRWLAQVGYERMEEIENPELGIERMRELYKAKGYATEWIDMRIQSIDIRKQLTEEWKKREVNEGQEYSILTAEIAKATFGLTPTEHKKFKGLEKENLRDHMTMLELIFTQLGEESTRQIAVQEDAKGFEENREVAQKGGRAAGVARKSYEKNRNVKVVSSDNFLQQIEASDKKTALPKDNQSETKAPE